LLRSRGYDVRTAADAEEVMRALEGFSPRLILMDIQLPGIDGLELTRRLRSNPRTSSVAIVAVTAYAMKGDEQRALDAGCDGYITKPIDTRALPNLVARYVRRGVPEVPP
jgi:CheY-like chemotaxis protein